MKKYFHFIILGQLILLIFSCSNPKTIQEAKQKEFFKAVLDNDLIKMEELLNDVDINKPAEDGISALHQAINTDNKKMVEFLLSNNADIMARNQAGETAYQAALSREKSDLAMIFLSHGQLVNKKAWITAPEGLRLRDKPGLDSNRLGVIPYNDEILVIKSSFIEFTITGDSGKWVYIDWNSKKGWVFDAYISYQRDLSLVLKENKQFRADHLSGAKKSNAAVSMSEEVHFLKDSRCAYYSTQYFFDATVKSIQRGIYTIEGSKAILLLDQGSKTTQFNEDSGTADKSEAAPAIQKILVWKDEIGGFLGEEDADKLENTDFVLDETTHQLKKESDKEFEYTGYFYSF